MDGVAVLPLDERNNVLTVTQYRYVFGRTMLEIPAGKLDPGEDPGDRRAAGAEGGDRRRAGHVFAPGAHRARPGCYSEVLHLFLARGLHMEPAEAGSGRILNVERIPFDEMVHRCMSGEIEDAKTIAAVLKAKILLNL